MLTQRRMSAHRAIFTLIWQERKTCLLQGSVTHHRF